MRFAFTLVLFWRTRLFRAVSEQEFEDILRFERLRNPVGMECKYFARTRRQAETYATLATRAYGEGPFRIVGTTINTKLISDEMRVSVEDQIDVVVVPSEMLSKLSRPVVIGEAR